MNIKIPWTLPWTRRAEDAEQRAAEAATELHDVERQWDTVDASTQPALRQRELNGWTANAKRLMGGAS